jgi:hypothetical protein
MTIQNSVPVRNFLKKQYGKLNASTIVFRLYKPNGRAEVWRIPWMALEHRYSTVTLLDTPIRNLRGNDE